MATAERVPPDASARFLASLGGLGQVVDEGAVIYGLWSDLTIAYFGPGWFSFCAANGGDDIPARWPLGRSVVDAWPAPLDDFYRALFERALRTGVPESHDFECSSATVYRKYRMTIYPLRDKVGTLVVNSLVFERPHNPDERPVSQLALERYSDARGFVTQCMHCRRTKLPEAAPTWNWVPALVEPMPANITHGLCDVCAEFYFPSDPMT